MFLFIERIVQVLGASKAIEIYKETQRVEADGGVLVMVSYICSLIILTFKKYINFKDFLIIDYRR